jgi:N-acetylglutamate synthase-like GNAT family acetyltransferase
MDDAPIAFTIRPLTAKDRTWVAQFLDEHWASTKIVSRGQSYYGHLLPGLAAFEANPDGGKSPKVIGLALYRVDGQQCEVMTLDSLTPDTGVGSALLDAVKQAASEAGCKRLWLVTTNDNIRALRFYQKRGFHISAVHVNALNESRRLKPQIPIIGLDGIPLRDEIELEMTL